MSTDTSFHPLDSLNEHEISAIARSSRAHVLEQSGARVIKHLTIALVPPPKALVLAYLGIPTSTDIAPADKPTREQLRRRARSVVLDIQKGITHCLQLSLGGAKGESWQVEGDEILNEDLQAQITPDELDGAEEIVRKDPQVAKLAAEVGLKPSQVFADGWSIGYDDRFDKKLRLQQCLLYARFNKHDNLYAHPLDFYPVIDCNRGVVIHIDFSPGRSQTKPPALVDITAAAPDDRIPPPLRRFEYLPDEMPKDYKYRDTLKPLHVVQPEGVSFSLDGSQLKWEKWACHVAFDHREGLVLNTVTYTDGLEKRPLFYRLSIAEMVVPYAETRHPHQRKLAFDVGEYGMGTLANDLQLGCDCLGAIQYLPGCFVGNDGSPTLIPSAICIHEEDTGILFKHTDYRKGGRAHVVRGRKLVIQMICTVANYEYLFAWSLHQDGYIELETRLSGMLNLHILAQGEDPAPYGTQVAPQINAQYHQHIFSLRIDPMIDGLANSVVESDIVVSPHPTGSAENWAGNGFYVEKKVVSSTKEGRRQADPAKERSWSIIGGRKHYASGQQGGYKIVTNGTTIPLHLQPDSIVAKRAPFTASTLWVTPFKEEQIYPAGQYVPQTRDTPKDSILSWMEGEKNLDKTDIVLYLTYGATHIPRPEDFPIMPVEHLRVGLKPVSFFAHNPALDVPAALDTKSVRAFGTGATRIGRAGELEGGIVAASQENGCSSWAA